MHTRYTAEGTVTPSCSKSHITYVVNIDDKITKLNIDFSYEPKCLDDMEISKHLIQGCLNTYCTDVNRDNQEDWKAYLPLKNLLTLSIDGPDGFRGAAHRLANHQQISISKESATYGFIKGDMLPGRWVITISVHAVVTEHCTYKLHVWEGESRDEDMDTL